jgi:glycosyltransferase involved in cell wall biosynthesis
MNLLMIVERFPPDLGGLARSAERIAGALGQAGVEVHVLAWTKTLPSGALETRPWSSGESTITLHRLGLFANLDLSLQETMNVLEWLHRDHDYRAIWGHYLFPAGFMAVLAARTFGRPSTVSARGNDVDRLMFPPGDFARLLWTLERADVVTAVSRDLARKIEILAGRHLKVEVIANVVDPTTFTPAPPDLDRRAALGIGPEEAVLGFCGELRHKKGLPYLLEALREVRRVRPASLLVIGEVRPRELTHLSTFSAESPEDAARIVVTGSLAAPLDVARDLRLCDVVLLPSVWDGLPNALLEAMACARPVIASDAGGIPEVIEQGVSGLLIPRALLHRLGEAVVELLEQPEARRAAIGAAARRRVVERFHPAVEREAMRRLLARLIPRTSS